MHAAQALFATLFAASAVLAAPTPSTTATSDWTIQNLSRECTEDESSCTWTFDIFDGETTTDCTYIVDGPDVSGGPTECGDFTILSNYVGDADPAWTQMSVVRDGMIIYPDYKDIELENPPVADFTQAPQPTP